MNHFSLMCLAILLLLFCGFCYYCYFRRAGIHLHVYIDVNIYPEQKLKRMGWDARGRVVGKIL